MPITQPLATGEWIWGPQAENEWCLVLRISGASIKYYIPSTDALATHATGVTALKQRRVRPPGDSHSSRPEGE
jgi:hypothetical protein